MSDDPLAPIQRLTAEDRVIAFEKASKKIYTKYSPYDGTSDGLRFGFQQPYVWTSISDSNTAKNLTSYDTQAIPIGSTVRDLERMGKFVASGTGLLYIGKQYLLQRQNTFNETRIYNPISIMTATAAKGSTGLIDRPIRFLPVSDGTIGDVVASSVLSLVGIQSNAMNTRPQGSAQRPDAISLTAGLDGMASADKGLVRFETGQRAYNQFKEKWVSTSEGSQVSFSQGLKNALIDKLKSFVPSTTPYLRGSNNEDGKWNYRPEYKTADSGQGVFEAMLKDSGQLLSFKRNSNPVIQNSPSPSISKPNGIFKTIISSLSSQFFGSVSARPARATLNGVVEVSEIHRYTPDTDVGARDGKSYPPKGQSQEQLYTVNAEEFSRLATNFEAMAHGDFPVSSKNPSNEVQDGGQNYVEQLGSSGEAPKKFTEKLGDDFTLDRRGFSKASDKMRGIGSADSYNMLLPFQYERISDGGAPGQLRALTDYNNSRDIIYFYFFDLINEIYIPFRATVTGMSDLHSPDWDEISYLGRADKLYVYKGFTREVNFSFTVYANSLKEMLPMWKRINYLVGLSRPTDYTTAPIGTPKNTSQFMYPPMVTFRMGDMYVDQPCVIKSIGVNIPEDAQWETQRGAGQDYSYLRDIGTNFSSYTSDRMYQLPTKADITINMSLLEKRRSIVDDDHFFVTDRSERPSGEANTPTATTLNDTLGIDSAEVFSDPSIPPALPSFDTKFSSTPTSLVNQGSVSARQFVTPTTPSGLPVFNSSMKTPTG